jgi:hypothetical protein
MSVGVMADYNVKCSAGGGGEELRVKVVSGQIFQVPSRVYVRYRPNLGRKAVPNLSFSFSSRGEIENHTRCA